MTAYAQPSEESIVFPFDRDGSYGLVMLSAEVLESYPIEGLGRAVVATSALQWSAPPGEFHAAEDALCKEVVRLGGRWAGHFVGVDKKSFVVAYLPTDAPPDAFASWSGHSDWAGIDTSPDPDWAVFDENLAPDAKELQGSRNFDVIMALGQQGDIHKRKRRVDHTATFSEHRAAQDFVGDSRDAGFEVALSEAAAGYLACASRVEAIHPTVGPGGIHDTVWLVRTLAEQHGGTYDGWGAPIARRLTPPWRLR